MPGASNNSRSFRSFDSQTKWFTAAGVPITSWDDDGLQNTYPLMRIKPKDFAASGGQPPTHVVLPVSDEMHCSSCHATNGEAAGTATMNRYGIASWSQSTDLEIQYRENVLVLHDAKHETDLMSTQPVLCASCHYSPALDLEGVGQQGNQIGKPLLSHAIHGRHGKTLDGAVPDGEPAVIPDTGIATCYYCHPGSVTQCLRGAMGSAGLICQDCHGGLLAVGGEYALAGNGIRTPWVDEPKCQSCHTGDALNHLGSSIRLEVAYNSADPAATPRIATNKRFAEENNKLYRNSLGHGGMACESCHGSPHAEWPVGDLRANDNMAAVQFQGHAGPIIECKTCHANGPGLTTNGPHGMHNVDDSKWNRRHEDFFENDSAGCKTCHGSTLKGTVLSRAAAYRIFRDEEDRIVKVAKGERIGCSICHENPLNDD